MLSIVQLSRFFCVFRCPSRVSLNIISFLFLKVNTFFIFLFYFFASTRTCLLSGSNHQIYDKKSKIRYFLYSSHKWHIKTTWNTFQVVSGERGIWTLAPVARPTPLAGAPLQPLEYFSIIWKSSLPICYWRHFVTQKLLYIRSMCLSIAFFINCRYCL